MSRRTYIAVAIVLTAVATIAGWIHVLMYKVTPPVLYAFWFPLVVITQTRELVGAAVTFIQFPLFAVAFAVGIRRWPVAHVVVILAVTYAVLVGIAYAFVMSDMWPNTH
jgi:hypothetical protein